MGKVISINQRDDATTDARLAAIVDSSFDAIISKDLNSIIQSWNGAAERLFGYRAEEVIGKPILILIPEGLKNEEVEIISRIRQGERVASYETKRLRKDQTLVSVSITVSPIRNNAGEIVGASKIARDISAAKESERRIKMLMREVNHRVKNQFAIIISMVRETAKRATTPKEFEAVIRDRIMALSRSHDLLVATDWVGASLFDLIQEHLKPFGHEGQVTLSGPLISLSHTAVQPLGMALHELATNSAKYGALSAVVGKVSVTWNVTNPASGKSEFNLIWEETSVPHEAEPDYGKASKGFGHIVLQRVTPQSVSGTAKIEHMPGYLRWSLVAPAAMILANAEESGIA